MLQTNARSASGWQFTDENGAAYDAVHYRYDAYGDLTGRGRTAGIVAPVFQESFAYDKAGRLWRSNEGDGVLRLHVHDKAGNRTLTLASAGADLSALTLANYTASIQSDGGTSTAGAVATVTRFDRRGRTTGFGGDVTH